MQGIQGREEMQGHQWRQRELPLTDGHLAGFEQCYSFGSPANLLTAGFSLRNVWISISQIPR
jgi:hypothetical protein